VQRRGSERRQFVRLADEVRVEIAAADGQAPDSQMLNFSMGGVLLVSTDAIPVGQQVRITLRPEGGAGPLRFDARVVRVRTLSDHSHEVAVEFVGGSAGDQRTLQEEIAARLGHMGTPQAPLTA
jgi:c-di-GMP-binding flagellar brake protein YcgR